MSARAEHRLAEIEREVTSLRKQLRLHRILTLLVLGACGAAVAVAASPAPPKDGTFNRVFARSVTILNESEKPAAQLYSVDGAGALLVSDPENREAIHLISGKERNDVIVYDRRGDVAAAVQGMADRGRFSLHRTFDNRAAAEAAQEGQIHEYFIKRDSTRVTVPVCSLPHGSR